MLFAVGLMEEIEFQSTTILSTIPPVYTLFIFSSHRFTVYYYSHTQFIQSLLIIHSFHSPSEVSFLPLPNLASIPGTLPGAVG